MFYYFGGKIELTINFIFKKSVRKKAHLGKLILQMGIGARTFFLQNIEDIYHQAKIIKTSLILFSQFDHMM